jgi:hypothetical protein
MRSNGVFSFGAALSFLLIALTAGCSLFSSKNDDCDATKMITPQEPILYLRVLVDPEKLNTEVGNYYLKAATRLEIIGSIEKVYCSGKLSGRFTYNPTFFPVELTTTDMTSGLYLPQPYQYKFDNDKDKLIVMFTLKARFSDGKIFETDTFSEELFFKDLTYDVTRDRNYFKLDYSKDFFPWKQVTSK